MYNPNTDDSWNMMFYDIDGESLTFGNRDTTTDNLPEPSTVIAFLVGISAFLTGRKR